MGFATSGTGDADKKIAKSRGKEAIERLFSPEFRNRLDAIVTFNPLNFEVMETIVEKFILQLEAQLAERRVAFVLEPAARAWLAKKGYDPHLRRASAGAGGPDRGPGSADRRDPVRQAGARRHGPDRPRGRQAGVRLRAGGGDGGQLAGRRGLSAALSPRSGSRTHRRAARSGANSRGPAGSPPGTRRGCAPPARDRRLPGARCGP